MTSSMSSSMSMLSDLPIKLLTSETEKRFIQKVQESHEKIRDYLKFKKLKWIPSNKKGVPHE